MHQMINVRAQIKGRHETYRAEKRRSVFEGGDGCAD